MKEVPKPKAGVKEAGPAKPAAPEPAAASKKPFDPYKAQIMTATKSGISVAEEQKLADASAAQADVAAAPAPESDEEKRKRAIEKARAAREQKEGD